MKPHRRNRGPVVTPWVRQEYRSSGAEVAWLASPAGQAVCRAMAEDQPAGNPAEIARWRLRLEPNLVAAAWEQVVLRRRARVKFARAEEMLFDRTALEQATDEVVAAHKARRFAGLGPVADLCCGIGGDAIGLAGGVDDVTAVDFSATRTAMTAHNAAVYGRQVTPRVGDAASVAIEAAAIHIDPDRRPAGKRTHAPAESSPSASELERLLRRYPNAAIKLSPGAELDDLPADGEREYISHRGTCVQLVLWLGRLATAGRRATLLPTGETLVPMSGEETAWPPPQPLYEGLYLYEPDPAAIRADLVGVLARRLGLAPVDPAIAYLAGDQAVRSHWLSGFVIQAVMDWSLKPVRQHLLDRGIGRLEVKTRGFAALPDEILHRLKLRGEQTGVLFITRLGERPQAILAERLRD